MAREGGVVQRTVPPVLSVTRDIAGVLLLRTESQEMRSRVV